MLWIDRLFVVVLEFSVLAFVLLTAGVLALRFFKQPIERIRLIQISLASVFIAALIGPNIPSMELAWLPVEVDKQDMVAAVTSPPSAASTEATAPSTANVNTPSPDAEVVAAEATYLADTMNQQTASASLPRLTPWDWLKASIVTGFLSIGVLQGFTS